LSASGVDGSEFWLESGSSNEENTPDYSNSVSALWTLDFSSIENLEFGPKNDVLGLEFCTLRTDRDMLRVFLVLTDGLNGPFQNKYPAVDCRQTTEGLTNLT